MLSRTFARTHSLARTSHAALALIADRAGFFRDVQSSGDAALLNDVLRHVPLDSPSMTMEHLLTLLPAVSELLTHNVDE
jgi:hypothetical protein